MRPRGRWIPLAALALIVLSGCRTLGLEPVEIEWTDRETLRVGQTALFDGANLEITLVAVDAADRATVQAYDAGQGRQRDLAITTRDPVGFGPYRVRLVSTVAGERATVEVAKMRL